MPSPTAFDGRNRAGRFTAGNSIGKGNPHLQAVARLRTALYACVTEADLQEVVGTLLREAKAGKPWAVRELLDRLLGRPPQAVHLTGDAGDDKPAGEVNLTDLQILVWEILEGHPDLRARLAQRLREFHDQRRPADPGVCDGPRPVG
jgi:hypothetical protein